MSNLRKFVVALATIPVLVIASPALAAVQSSVEGGDIYRVKNITKNVDFADPASADACNELMYKVRIHNPGPTDTLTGVTVQAAFQTAATSPNISTITVRSTNGSPSSTSDTATVNLSSAQGLSYVAGSTQLLDANGTVMQTLPDTITGAGVSIGNVGVSINEKRFVQFKMKVSCPTPTPEKPKPAPVKPVAKAAPTALPSTGPGAVAGLFAGASVAGAAGHYFITRRRQ